MDNNDRREIMLKAPELDKGVLEALVEECQEDIRTQRFDSNTRLKKQWMTTTVEEMDRIETAGRVFISLGVLAAVFALGVMTVLGKWLLGVLLAVVMLGAVVAFHRRLSYLALRIGRVQHHVSDLLSYGVEGREEWRSKDDAVAEYLNHQGLLTYPQALAIERYPREING